MTRTLTPLILTALIGLGLLLLMGCAAKPPVISNPITISQESIPYPIGLPTPPKANWQSCGDKLCLPRSEAQAIIGFNYDVQGYIGECVNSLDFANRQVNNNNAHLGDAGNGIPLHALEP